MSRELWVYGPGTLWVSEDHVIALADLLGVLTARLSAIQHGVARIAPNGVNPLTEGISSAPPLPLAPIVGALAQALDDAQWLRNSLVSYTESFGEQERARILTFDVPRDHLLALLASALPGDEVTTAWSSGGMREVASVALQGATVGGIEVAKVVSSGAALPMARATTVAERVGRIPAGETPIRVERYVGGDGVAETDVYLAGTQRWSVGVSDDPFDMESNIALIAGVSAASLVAVERALHHSGVKPGDRVNFVGHSQGGLVATRMAESGRYATASLLTVGAPLGTAPVRGDYPALALTHSDDVVPDLGGAQEPSRITRVERHSGAGFGDVGQAHSRERYVATAEAADASPARAHFPRWDAAGSTATPEFYVAKRVSD